MLRSILRAQHIISLIILLLFVAISLMWPATDKASPIAEEAPVHVELPVIDRETYQPERVQFSVQAGETVIPYRLFAIYVMPNEEVPIEALFTRGNSDFSFLVEEGDVYEMNGTRWMWTAPEEPGVYRLSVTDAEADETITLNAFVMRPFDHQAEDFNGFRIGRYEEEPFRGNPAFERPRGFIEVTPEIENEQVSPHFEVREFLSKQESGYPKYLVLQESLLLKLERLLESLDQEGIDATGLHVMSAFRTPWYNRSIGNTTSYSQHLYGGAADVFVDAERNGWMDDITGSGKVTVDDARHLASLVEAMRAEAWFQPLIGGLGIYGPAPHRGPFIHVDVRGEEARW